MRQRLRTSTLHLGRDEGRLQEHTWGNPGKRRIRGFIPLLPALTQNERMYMRGSIGPLEYTSNSKSRTAPNAPHAHHSIRNGTAPTLLVIALHTPDFPISNFPMFWSQDPSQTGEQYHNCFRSMNGRHTAKRPLVSSSTHRRCACSGPASPRGREGCQHHANLDVVLC